MPRRMAIGGDYRMTKKVIGRPPGSRNRNTMEFVQRYERMRSRVAKENKARGEPDAPCDPFEVLWALAMSGKEESQHRIQASRSLMPYRYPALKAAEVNADGTSASAGSGQLTLVWSAAEVA